MCKDISSHKAFYANIRSYKKKKVDIKEEKPRSSKVNWDEYEKYLKEKLIICINK
jgi:hypothetical protein